MQAFFSSEGSYALQFLVIFLVILVLFLLAALLFMRLSGRGLTLSANAGQRGRQPRLGIVDIYELDRQRQLILLRRDNVEHLLLVGGPNDVVIERHIQRGAGSRYAPEGGRSAGEIGGAEPGALEPPRTDPFFDSPMPPTFAMPEVVPPAAPGAHATQDRALPLDPGLFEPEIPPAEPRAKPASPVGRLMRRTTPPLVNPRPETASERGARPEPVPAAPEPTSEAPPMLASRGPRAVDPVVLSDMARQLQVALKRPSSAVTPPPGGSTETPASPKPSPGSAEPAPAQPDPVAAAMARAQPEPPVAAAPPPDPVALPPSAPPRPATPPSVASPTRPAPKPAASVGPATPPPFVAPAGPEAANPESTKSESSKSESTRSEPVASRPAKSEPAKSEPPKSDSARHDPATSGLSKSAPPRSEPSGPEPSKAGPAKAESSVAGGQAPNPFSVEEIEAEFARLLGRPLDSKN